MKAEREGWSRGNWSVCSLLGCLFRVLILESVCAHCVQSSRGRYGCLMPHFPTSACCFLCVFEMHTDPCCAHHHHHRPPTPSWHSFLAFHHSVQGLSPSMCSWVSCSPLPRLLLPLSAPVFNCHLLSLSHLVCSHFIIWPACCHCIMWAIMMIMAMMTN